MRRPAPEARRDAALPALGHEYQARLATPFAVLGIRTSGNRLSEIVYLPKAAATLAPQNRLAEQTCRQIERYLDDPEFCFDLPFEFDGTPFRQRVWQAIHAIPCGRTLTYGELARKLNSAPRAVGGACGDNRIPLVIPCHRVVASGGIGGFMHASGGDPIAIKQWLLRHERAQERTQEGAREHA
jgi:methylated-DNA-[protein]-cysteine S-methyltransferase